MSEGAVDALPDEKGNPVVRLSTLLAPGTRRQVGALHQEVRERRDQQVRVTAAEARGHARHYNELEHVAPIASGPDIVLLHQLLKPELADSANRTRPTLFYLNVSEAEILLREGLGPSSAHTHAHARELRPGPFRG
ncbi:hypothetical protein V8E53_012129 [Lactarius tabidus]